MGRILAVDGGWWWVGRIMAIGRKIDILRFFAIFSKMTSGGVELGWRG